MNMLEAVSLGSDHILLPGLYADANTPHTGLTILLAEDNDDLRLLMNCILITMGYRVIACADAHIALQAFRVASSIDLLVTDYEMPGMSGLELARKLTDQHADLPVLLVTGTILTSEMVKELVLRGWGYMAKPCDMNELKGTLHRLVNRNKRSLSLEAS